MKNNKKAYSVIISLLITGFLLLMIVGVFNLVLKELNASRAMGNYYKAFYGAESGQELALLKIKEIGYGIDDKIDFSVNDSSIVLSDNPTNKNLFKPRKDVFISYEIDTKTNAYSGVLDSLGYDIIPLFYIDNNKVEYKITDLNFDVLDGNTNELAWNIVSKNGGISGVGEFDGNTFVNKKNLDNSDPTKSSHININSISIKNHININNLNYLILFNTGENKIKYKINTINNLEYFSKPKTYIISSAKIGDYRQNLRTYLNNTEYLNILKYSIHSN